MENKRPVHARSVAERFLQTTRTVQPFKDLLTLPSRGRCLMPNDTPEILAQSDRVVLERAPVSALSPRSELAKTPIG